MQTSKIYDIIYYKVEKGKKGADMVKQKMELEVYVCEACGVIHIRPEEIFSVGGIEFCIDCIDFTEFLQDQVYGMIAIPDVGKLN